MEGGAASSASSFIIDLQCGIERRAARVERLPLTTTSTPLIESSLACHFHAADVTRTCCRCSQGLPSRAARAALHDRAVPDACGRAGRARADGRRRERSPHAQHRRVRPQNTTGRFTAHSLLQPPSPSSCFVSTESRFLRAQPSSIRPELFIASRKAPCCC